MTRMRGALTTALLASFLASGALAQGFAPPKPKAIWTDTWRAYHNPAYCYSIRIPPSGAELDTTDQAAVKFTITRAMHPVIGAEVRVSWVFLITVTPNPAGVTPAHWLEPGSGTPDSSSGIARIVEILWRRNLNIAGRNGVRKQVEGSAQRRNACFIAHQGYMYGVSYPALDLDDPQVLKSNASMIDVLLDTFELDDPSTCRIAGAGP